MNLAALKDLYDAGQIERALDAIFDKLDDPCLASDYAAVETILTDPDVLMLPTDLLLGVLTVTRPYRQHLPSRPALVAEVKRVLDERGEDTAVLLVSHLDS